MRATIDLRSVRNAIRFFGRSRHWLTLPWRYRVSGAIAYQEIWHTGRFQGLFGVAFSREVS